ncbi:MAG: hypothetical protein ACYDEH_03225 [Acidimicrobiales bacterium]
MTPTRVDQWLGDHTPPVVTALGGSLTRCGVDGEDLGWVDGSFTPTALAGGLDGTVPGGVLAVVLGAAMVMAVDVVAMADRPSAGVITMALEVARDPRCAEPLSLRGEVEALQRSTGSAGATLVDRDGALVAQATATLSRRRQ